MLIISDTSPIINLAAVHHLFLLPELFNEIIIPPAVFDEITIQGKGLPGSAEVINAKWIKIVPVKNQFFLEELKQSLDPGEAEAIAIGIELNAEYLLIDEVLGRKIAQEHHLKPLGILGILLRAKNKNLISLVKPVMDELKEKANFFIQANLYNYILELANET